MRLLKPFEAKGRIVLTVFRVCPIFSAGPLKEDQLNDRQRMTPMLDEKLARLRAHRNNIGRYHRLLQTSLTALERDFIAQRLSEEEAALNRLASDTFPLTLCL